jgi:hypothetical protein
MNETNHPSSLATCTLIQDLLGVKDGGIYEAVVNLKQQLDAVVAENVKAIAAVQTFADATEQLTEIIGDEIGMDGVANLLAAFAAVGNMPETSAALAEVEAKAIERFTALLGEQVQTCEELDMGDLAIMTRMHIKEALRFAAELREGRV